MIRLDPLDITGDMVDVAEQPELADRTLRCLPPRRFSLRSEAMQRRRLQKGRESPEAFVARLRAGGCPQGPPLFENTLLGFFGKGRILCEWVFLTAEMMRCGHARS